MGAQKRFYWMRFSKNFFQEHEIRIIESMPNGAKYLLFYIKLMAESVSHDGRLRCSDAIPYNEQMLAGITNTDPDVVHSAMEVLQQLDLVEIMDDKTLYMTKVAELIGSETQDAVRKRVYRARIAENGTMSGQCPENVPLENRVSLSNNIYHNSAQAREIINGENGENGPEGEKDPNRPDFEDVLEFIDRHGLRVDGRRFRDYYDEKGWPLDWRAKAITWDSFARASAAGKAEKREEWEFLDSISAKKEA